MKYSSKNKGFIAAAALAVAAVAILLGVINLKKSSDFSQEIDFTKNSLENSFTQLQNDTRDGFTNLNNSVSSTLSKRVGSVVPVTPSVFETSLAASIGTSDTTMTLAAGTLRDGTTISGKYCFTVDESTPSLEYICGTASGTSITALQRGIDPLSGTSTVSSITFAHRRGADVKVTDWPTLGILARIASGADSFNQPVRYDSTISTTTIASDRNNLASAGLVADTAFAGAGVINATTAASGVVQIATGLQTASSTATGSSGASLVVPASQATSTYNSSGSLQVVVTKNNNKIDDNFIATSTLFTNAAFTNGTTNISSIGPSTTNGTTTMATTTINGFLPFALLASTNATNTSKMTVSFPYRDNLFVQVYASTTATGGMAVRFNDDSGAIYLKSGPGGTGSTYSTSIIPSGRTDVAADESFRMSIQNPPTSVKFVHIEDIWSNNAFPSQINSTTTAAFYSNASTTIKTINIVDLGNGMKPASYIRVYGTVGYPF